MNKISIIIPCYNEKKTIEEILSRVRKSNTLGLVKEIIVVDDFSTDGTRKILEELKKKLHFHLLLNEKNEGKGYAIQKAQKIISDSDIVLIQDADLEYNPSDYPKLIRPFIESNAGVVYGSRFIGSESQRILYFWNRVANFFLTTVSNVFTNLNLTDMETGYKLIKTSLFKKIKINERRFGIEPEITIKLAKLKARFYEVGISYNGRTVEEGKKIRWVDGFFALYCILKYSLINDKNFYKE